MLSVTTLLDRLTAPAPRDTLEMEHHAAVKVIFYIGRSDILLQINYK